jgi:hypothetical protein
MFMAMPAGAMRSHMHHDAGKDLWSIELKVPRHMAPVTLGFVLWNSGALTHTLRRWGRGKGMERVEHPHLMLLHACENMAPVTLGFVLLNSGALTRTLCRRGSLGVEARG